MPVSSYFSGFAIFYTHLILLGLTYLYEAYFEVWKGGQFFKHVAKLHENTVRACRATYHQRARTYPQTQGPVVRITPNEVHFNDPEFLDTVYPGTSRKTNKPL